MATVPMVVSAVLGTSRPLSVSTTSTVAALTARAIAGADSPAEAVVAATTVACLAGAVLVLAGCLRLGYLADFIAAPVLAGFKVGTALVIVDGDKVGTGRIDATVPMLFSGDETTDVGSDTATPVSDDYGPKDSTFTGKVHWIQLDGDAAAEDLDHLISPEERLRVAMARQ